MIKNSRLEIRISTKDKELAKALSKNFFGDINLSKLFVKLLHATNEKRPIILDEQLIDFRLALRQLSGIARNLNQVTRRLNSDDNFTPNQLGTNYLASLKQYISSLSEEFKRVLDNNN